MGPQESLEPSNPRKISLDPRHGFEPLGARPVGGPPPVVPMLRGTRFGDR